VVGISAQDVASHETFAASTGSTSRCCRHRQGGRGVLRHARPDRVPSTQRVRDRRRWDRPVRAPGHRRADVPAGEGADRRTGEDHSLSPTSALQCEPVFVSSARDRQGIGGGRVLGIDPGLTRCGYAVVDAVGAGRAVAVSMGVIRTAPTDPLPQRLAALRTEFGQLIAEFHPDVVAVEQVFFQVNVRTAMSVGQASGLALAEAALAGCEVVQYTPNQVKDAVAGWGGADKEQVQKMVQARLGLAAVPRPPTPPTPRHWRCATSRCHPSPDCHAVPGAWRDTSRTGGRRDRFAARHRCSSATSTARCCSRWAGSATWSRPSRHASWPSSNRAPRCSCTCTTTSVRTPRRSTGSPRVTSARRSRCSSAPTGSARRWRWRSSPCTLRPLSSTWWQATTSQHSRWCPGSARRPPSGSSSSCASRLAVPVLDGAPGGGGPRRWATCGRRCRVRVRNRRDP
jgi:crossover junction endodeoxyribonuclease RuvC